MQRLHDAAVSFRRKDATVNRDVQHKRAVGPDPTSERDARRAKVAALKQAVQTGAYKIHTEDIVYNVIKEFSEQFG
jgi:anti-sigma28 factor (negative regulator of flagellin synthesis)